MDRAVERRVSTCMPYQASVDSKARDPLKPTKAPEEPWSSLYADHWGPTQDGLHLLVVIDGLTRYPEVAIAKGTGPTITSEPSQTSSADTACPHVCTATTAPHSTARTATYYSST